LSKNVKKIYKFAKYLKFLSFFDIFATGSRAFSIGRHREKWEQKTRKNMLQREKKQIKKAKPPSKLQRKSAPKTEKKQRCKGGKSPQENQKTFTNAILQKRKNNTKNAG
jgi:hypothetical protein